MLLTTLASSDTTIWDAMAEQIELTIVFGVGGTIAIVGIFFGTILSAAKRKETEKTKRELAAYVAEGTMSPEDAERIIRSDQGKEA